MRKQLFTYLSGVLTALLMVGLIGTAAATVGSKTATLDYNNISVTLDGQPVALVDANGNAVEPFAIAGTTYLPVRAVASALGLNVNWNSATSTVELATKDAAQGQNPVNAPTPPTTPAPTPAAPSGMTTGQSNALKRAKSYLNYSAFSRSGLIEQLEYEEYSNADATFAVDNCGADWNEQAVKKAKQYLEYSAFSKDSLIAQLEYEGFTHEQAVYGAEQNGY